MRKLLTLTVLAMLTVLSTGCATMFGQDKQFVLFCAMGWRSALATQTLQDMGVEKVAHIHGGFTAWKDAGAPVTEKAKKA